MTNYIAIPFILYFSTATVFANISWENPTVMCPEELFPKGYICPDLSQVDNPYNDFPDEITKEEIRDWKNNKAADLRLCRNQEVLRREKIKPGSYKSATLEEAWMIVNAGKSVKEKLDAIENVSLKNDIPPQILIGALKQESLLSSIGISPDGGNYSCGIAQLNIQEWCENMDNMSHEEKMNLGWPQIDCSSNILPTDILKPFYIFAIKNAGNRPSYELTAEDFKGIKIQDVSDHFPDFKIGDKQFQAVTSFIKNCQNVSLSIFFKAQTLKSLFDNYVPQSLKDAELYGVGKTFLRPCKNTYKSRNFPLHTGWLLAVAMYNAGPIQAKLLEHYFQVKHNSFPPINPLQLIEALHWGGKWKKGTDRVFFKDQNGTELSQKWFKSCIAQRHIARVVQHVTIPSKVIANSLDQEGCKPNVVPQYRQSSGGIRANQFQ